MLFISRKFLISFVTVSLVWKCHGSFALFAWARVGEEAYIPFRIGECKGLGMGWGRMQET